MAFNTKVRGTEQLIAATITDTQLDAPNANTGTFGDATHVGQFTVAASGRITAASSVAITATLGGSGTTGKLPKWLTSTSLTDSILVEASGQLIAGASTLKSDWASAETSVQIAAVGTGYTTMSVSSARADANQTRTAAVAFETLTNTTAYRTLAVIEAFTSGATANKRGGDLLFYTQANNTAGPAERMRLSQSGGLSLGNIVDPGNANLSLTGKVTTYANVATVGFGVPAIVGGARITGQTTNATIATFTPGADATLAIYGGGATTSGTWQSNITVTWTDADLGTAQSTNIFVITTGATIAGVTVIRAKASTVVTVKTVNTAGAGTYNAEGYMMQIA